MGKPPISDIALGSLVTSALKSGQEPETVVRFIELQTGVQHPLLAPTEWAGALQNFLAAGFGPQQLGRVIQSEMQLGAVTGAAATAGPGTVQQQYLTKVEFLDLLDKRLEGKSLRSVERKETVTKSLRVAGVSTSVSLEKTAVDEFVAQFGAKRLNQLLKEVGHTTLQPGQSRSYVAQQAINSELAKFKSTVYPHGIRVLTGSKT